MAGRLRPVFTENFATNVDAIRRFLEPEGDVAFGRLLDRLVDDVVPTLCRFPQLGRPFLAHAVRSLQGRALVHRLKALSRRGDDLREFIVDDYLILYVVREKRVIFLAIKHHRQLSFDLKHLWLEG